MRVQEYKGDFADFGYTNSGNMVAFEIDGSITPASSSSSHNPFSSLLLVDGISRNSFSYCQHPLEPLKLNVLKLDGSTFDIIVTNRATVADLKQAVEAAFSYLPSQGLGKVSWSHVWAQFCLCFEGRKLLDDSDSITLHGIQDGDQLQFVRHTSISYNLVKERSEKDSDEYDELPSKADFYNGRNKPSAREQDNTNQLCYDDNEGSGSEDVDVKMKCRYGLVHFLRGWLASRRLKGANTGYEPISNSSPSNSPRGITGSYGNFDSNDGTDYSRRGE